MDLVGVEM